VSIHDGHMFLTWDGTASGTSVIETRFGAE
jgi:hypothetical protein